MRRPKGGRCRHIDHGGVNRDQEKVSKAALFGTLLAVGLLDPAPSAPARMNDDLPRPAALAKALATGPANAMAGAHAGAPSSCTNPRRELRFEMIRSEREAYSPPAPRPVCLAVYRP